MRLIIIGPMASGKSVVGKKLSKRLDIDFYDTDEEIVKKTGVTISHIFDIEGEDKFRSREMNVFSDLIKKDGCVISTGGGIVLKQENRELLKKRILKKMFKKSMSLGNLLKKILSIK